MTKITTAKDWINKNITFVFTNGNPKGYFEMVAVCEFKAFDAAGNFIDWFGSAAACKKAIAK